MGFGFTLNQYLLLHCHNTCSGIFIVIMITELIGNEHIKENYIFNLSSSFYGSSHGEVLFEESCF